MITNSRAPSSTDRKDFGLDAFQAPATQAKSRAAWFDWIEKQGELATGADAPSYRAIPLPALDGDLQRGLIAHYSMDGIEAETELKDHSGKGKDGALKGKHGRVAGVLGDAVHFRTGAGMVAIPQAPADRGRWVHYAMSYDDGQLSVFQDGQFAGERALEVAVKGNLAALDKHWWNDGVQTSTRFIGAMDDIRVYDRSLNAAQVKRLHYQGIHR